MHQKFPSDMIFRMFHWKSSVVSGAELCHPEYRKRLRNATVPSLVFIIFYYMVRAIFRPVQVEPHGVEPHGNGDPSYGSVSGTRAGDCSFEATRAAWKKPPPKIYSGPDMPVAPVRSAVFPNRRSDVQTVRTLLAFLRGVVRKQSPESHPGRMSKGAPF